MFRRPRGRAAGPIRVLLVDDHALVRAGLRIGLEREPDIAVVGEGQTGTEALKLADELKPEVVLLDVSMPELSGIEVARELKERHPAAVVVVMTVDDREVLFFEALRAGASGYLLKGTPAWVIAAAIRATSGGLAVVEGHLLACLARGDGNPASPGERPPAGPPPA